MEEQSSNSSRTAETVGVFGTTVPAIPAVEVSDGGPEEEAKIRERLQACEITAAIEQMDTTTEETAMKGMSDPGKYFHQLQPVNEEAEFLAPTTSRKSLKRGHDMAQERKTEHKRWRTAIDGYAQYSEWVSKVSEKVEDMPDFEGTVSVASTEVTEDPEAEYFIAVDSMQDIIAQIEKARAAQSEETAESDAKLEEILKHCEEHAKRIDTDANKIVQDYQMFVCFACGRVFDDEMTMRNHVNEVHLSSKNYVFKCSKCYRRFKLKHHLQRHERTHDLSLVHTCDRCSSSFRNFESLITHRSRAHGINEDGQPIASLDYKCSRCRQKFGTFIELNRHKWHCLNDSGAKEQKKTRGNSPSSSTSSVFSSSSRSRVDTTCRICSTKFASRQSMIRHMGRKHPGEKIDEIKQYEVVHSPDLPFACNICSKRFATSTLMLVHRKRHDGRNFACELCDKTYPVASELRKHIKRVHEKSQEGASMSSATGSVDTLQGGIGSAHVADDEQPKLSEYEDLTDFSIM